MRQEKGKKSSAGEKNLSPFSPLNFKFLNFNSTPHHFSDYQLVTSRGITNKLPIHLLNINYKIF